MIHWNRKQRLSAAAAALLAFTMSATAVRAEEAAATDEEGPNLGALSISIDSAFTTAYMFRGIMVIRDGMIWQPTVELSLGLYGSEEGAVKSVDLGMGFWNSMHSQNLPGTMGTDGLLETDYYPSLSVTWKGGLTTGVSYYWYTSPNDSFQTVEEADITLSYDDSELLGKFAMAPTATFAIETKNSSYGTGKGSVVVLGISPGTELKLPFEGADAYPLALTFPVNLGLSMDHYYDDGTQNDAFGYATIGLHVGVPIACVPKRFGKWTLNNGFDVYFLDDALERTNNGDAVYPVWTSSISLEY